MSSHSLRQGMSKIPCHCTEECLQGVTPHDHEEVPLCSQECNNNTDTYPAILWWWTWCEMLGMEPHSLVVYFFCGVNLLKLGSE